MGSALIRVGESYAHIRGTGIKPCSCCRVIADYMCDYPMGKGKTCDAPLCADHAIVQGRRPSNQLRLSFDEEIPPEDALHFCPAHHLMARASSAAPLPGQPGH